MQSIAATYERKNLQNIGAYQSEACSDWLLKTNPYLSDFLLRIIELSRSRFCKHYFPLRSPAFIFFSLHLIQLSISLWCALHWETVTSSISFSQTQFHFMHISFVNKIYAPFRICIAHWKRWSENSDSNEMCSIIPIRKSAYNSVYFLNLGIVLPLMLVSFFFSISNFR